MIISRNKYKKTKLKFVCGIIIVNERKVSEEDFHPDDDEEAAKSLLENLILRAQSRVQCCQISYLNFTLDRVKPVDGSDGHKKHHLFASVHVNPLNLIKTTAQR